MDWETLNRIASLAERLAPFAWPLVALVALPFAVWKIDSLVKAIGQAKMLSEQMPDLLNLAATIRQVAEDTKDIKGNQQVEQAEKQAEESLQEELIDILPNAGDQGVVPAVDPDMLYQQLSEQWNLVVTALEQAYDRGNLGEPDRRSVGRAALRLTDGRRRQPIQLGDAELLASLQGIYKRFVRLRANNPEALTPAVVASFTDQATAARGRLAAFAAT